jgi:AAHS family 4-hydroxybenzoate transporter-like MFS transporter
VGGGLPLVLAAVLWMLLPESPHYVAEKNRAGGRARFNELFGPALRRDTTGLWIAFLFSLGSIYLVFGWLPAMLNSQGFGLAGASEALALYNFGGVAGVLIWAVLIQRSGSRGPMLGAALGAAVTALAILYSGGRRGWALVFITMNGLLANAVQVALYAVAAHIYPTRVRASGMGCAASIGRAGGVVTSIYGSALIVAGPMAYWSTLAGSMAVAFAGIAWIRRHIPQVRN